MIVIVAINQPTFTMPLFGYFPTALLLVLPQTQKRQSVDHFFV